MVNDTASIEGIQTREVDAVFDFNQVDFVTSDHHFHHERIIDYSNRGFGSVDEMNEELIRVWNDQVGEECVVLHLGDLVLSPRLLLEEALDVTDQLNGRKLLVPGNHDWVSSQSQTKRRIDELQPVYEQHGWQVLPEQITGTRDKRPLQASHYPFRPHNTQGRQWRQWPTNHDIPLLHGHTHSTTQFSGSAKELHVGVDAWQFALVPMTTVDAWLDTCQ